MTTNPQIEFNTRKHGNITAIRRERRVREHYLEQINGPGMPRRVALEKDEIILGRAQGVDVELPSTMVSRYHALMVRRGPDYVIRDNESQNGVFLNGVKIHSATLREGDVIQAAEFAFIFREG
jgi:pSer/pThr/pTyr-binding forkhead associated (FHA) protein